MADVDFGLEPDRLDGTPHPRETLNLVGHVAAEAELLAAYRTGRMHHAWILGGEPGIGKATLAYRLARFILANPDPKSAAVQHSTDLSVRGDAPAARRMAQLSHPDLFILRRGLTTDRKSLATEIRVEDARRLVHFFGTTAGEGGWRVAVIDSAEDLNISSANALLKVLEEPPSRSLFLIMSSTPKRLLPTIRSRCRMLPMQPLRAEDVAAVLQGLTDLDADSEQIAQAAQAAGGSVRRAVELLQGNRIEIRAAFAQVLAALPEVDYLRVHELAEQLTGRDGAAAFEVVVEQVLDWLHSRVQSGAATDGVSLARWAELWEKTARAAREADIFNLDRRPLVLAIVSDLAAAQRG
jgi:DNA polymerase-3 subunit delta'